MTIEDLAVIVEALKGPFVYEQKLSLKLRASDWDELARLNPILGWGRDPQQALTYLVGSWRIYLIRETP